MRVVAVGVGLLLLLSSAAPRPSLAQDRELGPSAAAGGVRTNEFGPEGGMCMDACGPGCPSTCRKEQFRRCAIDPPNSIETGVRYTCGTHEACAIHDDCLEQCKVRHVRPTFGIADPAVELADFAVGECNWECHMDALDFATSLAGGSRSGGLEIVTSWARGKGPYTGSTTWEYTRNSKDEEDVKQRCSFCETCEDGRCVYQEDLCGPCVSCGDVHLTTLDRLRFGFQSVGEFLLAQSDDGSLAVQARQRPMTDRVSINKAVAMNVAGDRVGIYLEPEVTVRLNGEVLELAAGEETDLSRGGRIVRRDRRRFQVVWPDGSHVGVAGYDTSSLHVSMRLAASLRGRIFGVAGNFDGDPQNDLRLRDGRPLASRDWDEIHGAFAESWRIRQAESLFDYAAGEDTETWTDRSFPSARVTLDELDPEAREEAEIACREHGVLHPRLLRDCILDVVLSGDRAYALNHYIAAPPQAEVPTGDTVELSADGAGLEVAARVASGSTVAVTWQGTPAAGDYVRFAGAGQDWTWMTAKGTARLAAPVVPGEHRVEYVQGRLNLAIAGRPVTVVPATATLAAVPAAPSGSRLSVEWTGPAGAGDYILVAEPGAARHRGYRYTRHGSPLELTVPDEPGEYELRYVQGRSNHVLATAPLTVTGVSATLAAPRMAPSGSRIAVEWSGPDNNRDYISIAEPETDGYRTYRYTRHGSPLALTVPDEPGEYELRYVQARSRNVLATAPLTVTDVTATLAAPQTAPSGSRIAVEWSGPDNNRDYISIAEPGTDGYRTYRYTRHGSPLALTVPDEPGEYELRYVQARSRNVLATAPVTVTDVSATLTAPATAAAGSRIAVAWTGPGNRSDYLAIGERGEDRHRTYRYTRHGSPLELTVPDEPGRYEIRYVQGQSRRVLARSDLTVSE